MFFKNYWGSIGWWWTCVYLGSRFIKVKYLIFFKKKVLSDVRSDIRLVRCNIISTGQSVRDYKIIIFRLAAKFRHQKTYSEPSQLFKIELFLKIYNVSLPLTIFGNCSSFHVQLSSECNSYISQNLTVSPPKTKS